MKYALFLICLALSLTLSAQYYPDRGNWEDKAPAAITPLVLEVIL